MTEHYFEEEEFTTKFTGNTTKRIFQLAKPHWKWVLGFLLLITLVSLLDSYFTGDLPASATYNGPDCQADPISKARRVTSVLVPGHPTACT